MPEALRLPAMQADPKREEGLVTIRNARVFADGVIGDPTNVIIEDGVIVATNADDDGGGEVIDAGGRCLLPGLIDAHAHLTMLERSPLPHGTEPLRGGAEQHVIAANLRRGLRMGITTIRDVGAHGDVLFQIRQAMRLGAFEGPRLFLSGRIVSATAPGDRFFPDMYRQADGADDMRRAVREQIRAGADFVKIMATGARSVELEDPNPSQVTREEMRAMIEEAHRQGYRVAAHSEGLAGTALAIEEGADTIEHGFQLHRQPELLDQLAARNGVLVPAFAFLHQVAEDGRWAGLLVKQGIGNVEEAHLTQAAAVKAGVRLAMGFDSPEVWRSAAELIRMVEHGLSPAAALMAATQGGAQALGIDEVLGSIAPSKLADLVIVDGDPLTEPAILLDPDRIWLVMKSGRPVSGAALDPNPPWKPGGRS